MRRSASASSGSGKEDDEDEDDEEISSLDLSTVEKRRVLDSTTCDGRCWTTRTPRWEGSWNAPTARNDDARRADNAVR